MLIMLNISVPVNLAVKVPENVKLNEAAFTTVGSIALQGIRRANIHLGDNVVVLGLGLLGQIACQILKAAGAHVIGIDTIIERNELAVKLGAEKCFIAGKNVVKKVIEHTNGLGADSVIIYAATDSNEPVKQAITMARKKGKIVVVGDVGMEIDRSPFYEKELDFLISCSYGPGRYDKLYEEKGFDYPIAYVRWTENRNMEEFLKLILQEKIDLESLIDHTFGIKNANKAYQIFENKERPIGVLFKYKGLNEILSRKISLESRKIKNSINVAVIGVGNYAQTFHLPNLKKMDYFNLKAVVARSGSNVKEVAGKYNAEYFTTDYREAVTDESIDLVMISTRHNLHKPLIMESAALKKDIFVEKPLAMTYEDCDQIYDSVLKNKVNLTVGFNRRMSELAQKAKKITKNRENPLMIIYRVNSPNMNIEHWINDPVEGGGAIIGECCHFFDFCNWIVGKNPKRIYAEIISTNNENIIDTNNMSCIIKYEDGSVASIIYSTIGNDSFSKERIEIFGDECVISIDDFKKLVIKGSVEINKT
jgi:Predicted dehydrogenases and related proteins